jgi:hypothetical protein
MSKILTAKAITFDIDWAPDFMIAECMDICARAGVPASFYATHPSPLLAEIEQDRRFELGIHPNFMPHSSHGRSHREVLAYCLDLAPLSSSMRTHYLYQSGPMFSELTIGFPQIRVDASLYLPGHENLRAVDFHVYGKTIRRLPFFWQDNGFAEAPGADWRDPPVTCEGLNIFAFHPVHISLNTERVERYKKLKTERPVSSWDYSFIKDRVNSHAGAKTFLQSLVSNFPKSDFMTITEMADAS